MCFCVWQWIGDECFCIFLVYVCLQVKHWLLCYFLHLGCPEREEKAWKNNQLLDLQIAVWKFLYEIVLLACDLWCCVSCFYKNEDFLTRTGWKLIICIFQWEILGFCYFIDLGFLQNCNLRVKEPISWSRNHSVCSWSAWKWRKTQKHHQLRSY